MASRKHPHCAKAEKYATDVISGKVVAGKWTRLACERHLADIRKSKTAKFPFTFDPDAAEHVCQFVELLPHIKGPLANKGERITLEPWQCFYFCSLFGWLHKQIGLRRFRRSYLSVARGNAKSTMSAALALYMLAPDGEAGAEVCCAATTRKQAGAVFSVAKEMASKSPLFLSTFGVEVLAHAVVHPASASRLEAISSEAQTQDSLNIHYASVDELHAHPDRRLYDVIETACQKRNNSLLSVITTAGSNLEGICKEVETYCQLVLTGNHADETQFALVYTLDEDDDWHDKKVWAKANPSLGGAVDIPSFTALYGKASVTPAAQSNFRIKHLNQWVQSLDKFFDLLAWNRGADPSLSLEQFEGEPCVIGLDLATRLDMAAKVYLFWADKSDGRHYYIFLVAYIPEDSLIEPHQPLYRDWAAEERFTVCFGGEISYAQIKEELLADNSRFEVRGIFHDPWQAKSIMQELAEERAPVFEYAMKTRLLSDPMKELQAAIQNGRVHHNGCPVLAWCIANVVAREDNNGNVFPRKQRKSEKIDGAVALILAIGGLTTVADTGGGGNFTIEVW